MADTETTWYEYRPLRSGREGDFVILIVCESAGVEEIDVHYHHSPLSGGGGSTDGRQRVATAFSHAGMPRLINSATP